MRPEERTPAGLRLPARQVRDERLRVSMDLLQLMLRDIAVLPTRQQEDVREAVKRLQRVQQWCQCPWTGE
jgi:hypothetical protein